MGITSTDNQTTAEEPIVEASLASKAASPPTSESEPAPTETSKPVSHHANAPRPAWKHSRLAHPAPPAHQPASSECPEAALSHAVRTACAHALQTSVADPRRPPRSAHGR
jgi:hypothetical protein